MAQLANLTTTLAIESAAFVNGIEQSRGAVRRLVASLDPAAAAQAKFNRQMDLAERGLKSGQLSADLYAKVVDRLKQRLDTASASGSKLVQTNGMMRSGMQQLSFQLSDVAQGFAMGTPYMTIFAQQAGQVIQAVQIMTTESKGFLSLLGGPWGIAISGAVSVAVALGSALLNSADASDKAKDSAKSLEDAIHDLAVAQGRAVETSNESRAAALNQAEGMRQQEIQARRTAKALLEATLAAIELNKQRIAVAAHDPRISGSLLATNEGLDAQIAGINKQIAAANKGLADANSAIVSSKIAIFQHDVAVATDKSAAANDRYDRTLARLNQRLRAGSIGEAEYKQALIDATNARDAALESSSKSERAHGRHAKSAKEDAAAIDLVAAASKSARDAVADLMKTLDRSPDDVRRAQDARFKHIFGDDADGFSDIVERATTAYKTEQDAQLQGERELQRVREDNVRDLSDMYFDLFDGGTKRWLENFQRRALSIFADLLAKWTLNALNPKGGGGGGFFASLAKSIGGLGGGGGPSFTSADLGGFNVGPVNTGVQFSGLPAFAGGGSFRFGGRDGIDKNILSLNGSPIARVSKGETATIGRAANDPGSGGVMEVRLRDDLLEARIISGAARVTSDAFSERDRIAGKKAGRAFR